MQLLELYKEILATAGMIVNENGLISQPEGLKEEETVYGPAILEGKRLVLPTRERLRSADFKNEILFNPMSENSMEKGESVVITKLRTMCSVRINVTIFSLVRNRLTNSTYTRPHKGLQKPIFIIRSFPYSYV